MWFFPIYTKRWQSWRQQRKQYNFLVQAQTKARKYTQLAQQETLPDTIQNYQLSSVMPERLTDADLTNTAYIMRDYILVEEKLHSVESWNHLFSLTTDDNSIPDINNNKTLERIPGLQKFNWLKDFEGLSNTDIQQKLAPVLTNWFDVSLCEKNNYPVIQMWWAPLCTAQRAQNWCLCLPLLKLILSDKDISTSLRIHYFYLASCLEIKSLNFISRYNSLLGLCYLSLLLDYKNTQTYVEKLYDLLTLDDPVPTHFSTPAQHTWLIADLVSIHTNIKIHTLLTTSSQKLQTLIDMHWSDFRAVHIRNGENSVACFNGGVESTGKSLCLSRVYQQHLPQHDTPLEKGTYAVQTGGQTRVIMDTALNRISASALSFEMYIGKRCLVTSCASGPTLSQDWQNALKQRNAHSTLVMHVDTESVSRSSLASKDTIPQCRLAHGHIQYQRQLELSRDGFQLRGSDLITPLQGLHDKSLQNHSFNIRFHLHPDVTSKLNERKTKVILVLPTGEQWYMQSYNTTTRIALEKSVYYRDGKIQESSQVVLTGQTATPARVDWLFKKLDLRKAVIRDLSLQQH